MSGLSPLTNVTSRKSQIYIHRSGVEEYNRCPRAFWYTYLHAGIGITISPPPIYFAIGTAVHEGLAASLRRLPVAKWIEAALISLQLDTVRLNNPTKLLDAQLLVEALLLAWQANGYEQFHRTYRVLHIEEEVEFVQDLKVLGRPEVEMHWMSRPDAIVREKYGPVTVGISWKTIDDANEFRRSFFSYDLQGLFEMWFGSLFVSSGPNASWGAEALSHWQDQNWSRRVDAIQTIFLQKGKRLKEGDLVEGDLDGNVVTGKYNDIGTDNFLIRPWVVDSHASSTPFFNEFPELVKNMAWKGQYTKPGNKSYNRLTGMTRSLLRSEDLPRWIQALQNNQAFPHPEYNNGEAALDKVVIWDEPVLRNDMQADAAIRETRYKFFQIAVNRDLVLAQADQSTERFNEELEKYFPRSWGKACKTPIACPHTHFCYHCPIGGQEIPAGFEMRTPHHEPEKRLTPPNNQLINIQSSQPSQR